MLLANLLLLMYEERRKVILPIDIDIDRIIDAHVCIAYNSYHYLSRNLNPFILKKFSQGYHQKLFQNLVSGMQLGGKSSTKSNQGSILSIIPLSRSLSSSIAAAGLTTLRSKKFY